MLRDLWNRLVRRRIEQEEELEQMSPSERRFAEQPVQDIATDEFIGEHLGGTEPRGVLGEDEPPRT
jgi:hypothetical protein